MIAAVIPAFVCYTSLFFIVHLESCKLGLKGFAGPNGSGKSTLIEDVKKHYNVGYFVNADIIEKQLKTQGFINCEEYVPTPITQYDWESFQLNAENK